MYTLGHDFVPEPIHAGGLRYHGMSPLVSNLIHSGVLRPMAVHQTECYDAALKWARTEGFISAPETAHALAAVIIEARKAKEEGKEKTILFNWSGHGLMDLLGYEKYLSGNLINVEFTNEQMERSLKAIKDLPKIPGA
jgi:tryptophan synthase beta chain